VQDATPTKVHATDLHERNGAAGARTASPGAVVVDAEASDRVVLREVLQ
jgi:hypothetical protein